MKILTWNCKSNINKLRDYLEEKSLEDNNTLSNKFDIIIIIEYYIPNNNMVSFEVNGVSYNLFEWVGYTKYKQNRGIAVFYNTNTITESINESCESKALIKRLDVEFDKINGLDIGSLLEYSFLPFEVNKYKFLAIWTRNFEFSYLTYKGQLLFLANQLKFDENYVFLGDFNTSNIQFFADIVKKKGLISAYHNFNENDIKEFGEEDEEKTYYKTYNKKITPKTHIDYVFANKDNIKDFKIIDKVDLSDHRALYLELKK